MDEHTPIWLARTLFIILAFIHLFQGETGFFYMTLTLAYVSWVLMEVKRR